MSGFVQKVIKYPKNSPVLGVVYSEHRICTMFPFVENFRCIQFKLDYLFYFWDNYNMTSNIPKKELTIVYL